MAVSLSFSAVATGQTTATLSWSISGVDGTKQPWTVSFGGSGSFSPSSVGPTSSFSGSGSVSVTGLSAGTTYSWMIYSETPEGVPGPYMSSNSVTTDSAPPPSYPPSWSDNTLAGFTATVVYSDGVSATNMSYSGSYSVSAGSLPAGISLNSSSGAVTGTPTTVGAYSFTITASNSYGSVSQAFSGSVAAAPTAGKLKVWNGSVWVYGPVKVWNGSAWVTGVVKVWNGTGWTTSV